MEETILKVVDWFLNTALYAGGTLNIEHIHCIWTWWETGKEDGEWCVLCSSRSAECEMNVLCGIRTIWLFNRYMWVNVVCMLL